MAHYKYCKYCKGQHRLKSAFNRCKRKNKQDKWE